jgi:hypothetical protein
MARDDARLVRTGWECFLARYEWQWFVTLTFADAVHPEAADKAFRLFVSSLNRSLYGPRWAKKGQGVYWIRATEFQKRGVLHYHALMADPKDLEVSASRMAWRNWWFERFGIADIQKPYDIAAASGYVAKYVAKEGELDISDNLATRATIRRLAAED